MMIQLKKPDAIVCNIEGTITSIRFWNEILNVFVYNHIEECLEENWLKKETNDVIAFLRNKAIEDYANGDQNGKNFN